MAIPPDIRTLVEAWCDDMTPDDVKGRARLEAEFSGNKVTIFECTSLRHSDDWLRVPSAQLRLDPQTRVWALYWIDSHDRWHIVQARPSLDVRVLLAEVKKDPDCLFFG